MTLCRPFNTCLSANIVFDLNIAADNYVSSITVDGSPTSYFWEASLLTGGYYNSFYHPLVTFTVTLGAGAHTLNVTVNQYPDSYHQGAGLNIQGTINSYDQTSGLPILAIESEGYGCPGATMCPVPGIIGVSTVCAGSSITLTDIEGGGTWSCSPRDVAIVTGISTGGFGDATGVVTGVSAGIANITYTDACGRPMYYPITVNPAPDFTVSSNSPICEGYTLDLNSDVAPCSGCIFSYDWAGPLGFSSTSADPTITGATVSMSGVYTLSVSNSYHCQATQTLTATVNPSAEPISGATSECVGSSTTFTDASTGGTWSSSDGTIATVGSTGVVTGILPGSATISYSMPGGCYATATITITGPYPISGASPVCAGQTISLTDVISGGTWSTSDGSIATVGSTSGIVMGSAAGTVTISYAFAGCVVTSSVTVDPLPDPITGYSTVCTYASMTLADATGGGTWSSSETGVATVGSSSGVVTGVETGTTVISYTLGTGCFSTYTVVNTAPYPITGFSSTCMGSTINLSDAPGGGTWSSSDATVATVGSSSGVVTGVASGTATISYTIASGCFEVSTISVLSPIAGPTAMCDDGSTIIISDATSGGFWTSSFVTVSEIGTTNSAVVTSSSPGIGTITYTLPSGCSVTESVTVFGTPLALPPQSICLGLTSTLIDLPPGGTWSSSNTTIATIGSSSGMITGLTLGTGIITYSVGSTCIITTTVTVNPISSPITGTNSVCVGLTTALSDDGGGAWSSSNTATATVGTSSGTVTGVSAGTSIITYMLSAGCFAITTVTVLPLPPSISGVLSVCAGLTTILNDGSPGGTWSSGSTDVGSVDGSGVVTGITAGTTVITYTLGTGCITTTVATVNPLPAAITGTMSVCVGLTTGLADATPGGTWYDFATGVATVSHSGVVTGIGAGTAVITYALVGTGCIATAVATVNPLPSAITGTAVVCSGFTTSLSDASTGGSWTSGTTSIATIGSGTGIVTGIAAGTATITYMTAAGCIATTVVTVNPSPTAITGLPYVCIGGTAMLGDATAGGAWSSSTGSVGAISGTGDVSGISVGTTVISYILSTTGCFATAVFTVNPLPGAISGVGACLGEPITFTDPTSGGTWTSSATGVASVGSLTGAVTGGTLGGTAVITYTLPTGCISTETITVNPSADPISGLSDICLGSSVTLSDIDLTGTWSSSVSTVASVGSTGIVAGLNLGAATISYILPVTGCYSTIDEYVYPLPAAITGTPSVCVGLTSNLFDATPGGTWTSGTTSVATITGGTGVVAGASAGTSVITYMLGTGCYATTVVTVNPLPAAISGIMYVCVGSLTSLADATVGGSWYSAPISVATVGSAGTVTGVSAGTATIIYMIGTGCYANATLTVDPLPLAITGTASICLGTTSALHDGSSGGTWSSSSTGIATIGSTSGAVGSVSDGISVITYTLGTGCYATTTVSVFTLPAIFGTPSACAGSTSTLADAVSGGTWSSSNTSIATVGASTGVVSGVGGSEGTAVVTYTLGTGCLTTAAFTVNPIPDPISGVTNICQSQTVTLSDIDAGGTWSGSSSSISISGSGYSCVVTGVSLGTAIVTFTLPSGCYDFTGVMTYPLPGAVTGTTSLCTGVSTTLGDPASGGTWTSEIYSVASITGRTGVLTALTAGTTMITYTLGTGCYATAIVTVNPEPSITGTTLVCVGSTETLGTGVSGGTWSSGSTSVATIASGSGIVTGVSSGTSAITYVTASGCVSAAVVTVDPSPASVTGPPSVCAGSSITLTDGTGGGTWASSSTGVATIGTGTGIAMGVTAGTATMIYIVPGYCEATYTVTVNPLPLAITGVTSMCVGMTASLADATGGGTWSSSAGSVATVGISGIVTGVSAGTAMITYTTGAGCIATTVVTVEPLPVTITGAASVCAVSGTTLTGATSGGTWGSSNGTVATIGSTSGAVTGVAEGTTTISYILPTGCYTTIAFTVNPMPAVITGSTTVCMAAVATLSDATTGGGWTSGNTSIATVGSSSGIVTGVFSGTTTITYAMPTGCYVTTTVTVPGAPAVTGGEPICVGQSMVLTDAATGGTWTTGPLTITLSPMGVVTSTVTVTGVTGGTALVTYIVPSPGCTEAAVYTVTVNPLPVLAPNLAVVLCGTVTLTANTGGGGATTAYTWATSTGLSATTGLSVTCSGLTTVGITVYTITATDQTTGCQSTATDTVVVPCGDVCTTGFCVNEWPIPIGGNIGTDYGYVSMPVGNYYVYDNLTLHGTVVFTGSVLTIASGVRINVDALSDLEISGCHLLSCGPTEMWDGIFLENSFTTHTSATCHISGMSLIEDAILAVSITQAYMPASGATIFTSDGVIFNRNITGVGFSYFPAFLAAPFAIPTQYPFLVRNTVFTSRDLSGYAGYPCAWPATTGTATSLAEPWWPGTSLLPPFNIDNPMASGVGSYSMTACKSGAAANIGIDLTFVGDCAAPTGPLSPATFNDITVGDNSLIKSNYDDDLNLFDNLHEGISAQSSNLTCYNNAFIHMHPTTAAGSGSGIYTTATYPLLPVGMEDHSICQLQVLPIPPFSGSIPLIGNQFYDCVNGVYSYGYYYVTGQYSQMFSSVNNPTYGAGVAATSGTYGYDIGSARYRQISLTNNTFTDIWNTGIFMKTLNTGGYGRWLESAGSLNISDNTINSDVGGAVPTLPQYVENGIVVANVTGTYVYTVTGMVNVNANIINYVHNGITVRNYLWQPISTDTNYINLVANPWTGTVTPTQQFGINNTNCNSNTIFSNTINGPGGDVPLLPFTQYGTATDMSIVGIYSSISSITTVNCNEVNYTNSGFEFYGQMNPTFWFNNVMHKNAQGYVLEGQIGPQLGVANLSQNIWFAPAGWWTYGPGPHNQTLTLNLVTNPTLSPLYMSNTTTGTTEYDPSINNNNLSVVANIYGDGYGFSAGYGLFPYAIYYTPACDASWVNTTPMSLYVSAARQNMGYVAYVLRNNWMTQMALWNVLSFDSTLVDSSAVLNEFQTLAAGSRFAWLNSIEHALAINDTGTASGLLSTGIDTYVDTALDTATGVQIADDTLADTVVQNYLTFYNLLFKYKTAGLSSADSCQLSYLSHLCPIRDGAIIYEARGLYNLVFDDPGSFNDNCDDAVDSTGKDTCSQCANRRINAAINNGSKGSIQQGYKLFPNPNDGSFALQQQVADNAPVIMEIWDATGQVVLRQTQAFIGQTLQLQLGNITPGLYMIQLTDYSGRRFNIKFVVNKP